MPDSPDGATANPTANPTGKPTAVARAAENIPDRAEDEGNEETGESACCGGDAEQETGNQAERCSVHQCNPSMVRGVEWAWSGWSLSAAGGGRRCCRDVLYAHVDISGTRQNRYL
nr:hypothetical protein [uncultured Rhodococcus sp.]